MNKSTKTSITKNEYLQLVGLQTLSESYLEKLDDLEKTAYEITGELDKYSYTTDMIFNDRDIDDVLKQLGIEVRN